MSGVHRAVVGYTGGVKKNPTYQRILDSTESILLEYDPEVVTYEDLLMEWGRMHHPFYKQKTQYRSAIFYENEDQKAIALKTVAALKANSKGAEVFTSVEPASAFYKAEEYHQNFLAKQGGF